MFKPAYFNVPIENFNYASEALQKAITAADHANLGYKNKERYHHLERLLRKWEGIMCNSPVVGHTLLFLLFFMADILVSWEMNRDILSQAEFFSGEPPAWAILLICLLINGWAAVSANFIARGWARDIQEMERWNTFYIKSYAGEITDMQNYDLNYERNRSRLYALVSNLVLFLVVGLIIWHRWSLIAAGAEIDAEEGGGEGLASTGVIIIVLPIAILIGELLTGDYIWYLIQRVVVKAKHNNNYKSFLKHKRFCSFLDKQAFDYHNLSLKEDRKYPLGAELEKSLFRVQFRSLDQDDYMDPVATLHRISFRLQSRATQAYVSNTRIFGVLPNGAKISDFITDQHGFVTMSWTSNFDRLELVCVEDRTYPGPFLENSEHFLLVN